MEKIKDEKGEFWCDFANVGKLMSRHSEPGAFSPLQGGRQVNRTKYNILNNYLGFIYLGVAIPNLFVALTRFLLAIAIASSSL